MVDTPHSHRDVVNLWKRASELAKVVGEADVTVRQWRNRNSIPHTKWPAVIKAAKQLGCKLSWEQMLVLDRGRRSAAR